MLQRGPTLVVGAATAFAPPPPSCSLCFLLALANEKQLVSPHLCLCREAFIPCQHGTRHASHSRSLGFSTPQGYLAHKKQPPRGALFLMSEVPLQRVLRALEQHLFFTLLTLPHRIAHAVIRGLSDQTAVQGYLGYKNIPGRGSVGRWFLYLRRPLPRGVGVHFLELRYCTKVAGPRFLNFNKNESGYGWGGL